MRAYSSLGDSIVTAKAEQSIFIWEALPFGAQVARTTGAPNASPLYAAISVHMIQHKEFGDIFAATFTLPAVSLQHLLP